MGQSTENRLEKELIKEIKESKLSFQEEESKSSLLKQKSNYIKDQISKNLMEK
jgi:ATP/maltotriose-dependent transcriptional regulator MalT